MLDRDKSIRSVRVGHDARYFYTYLCGAATLSQSSPAELATQQKFMQGVRIISTVYESFFRCVFTV